MLADVGWGVGKPLGGERAINELSYFFLLLKEAQIMVEALAK